MTAASTDTSRLYPLPLALATYLGWSGYRKGSLSRTGALTASAVGYATMANPFPGYGVLLITFYLAGSRATKYKSAIKASLETHASSREQSKASNSLSSRARDTSSGNRSATQVLCNSLISALAALAYRVSNANNALADPLSSRAGSAGISNRFLTLIVLGHFAACLGDTLSSELGILSQSAPRLVTQPWRVVPKGTNGGVSAWGTLVAGIGGAGIGAILCASLSFFSRPLQAPVTTTLVALGTAAGLMGSLIDSVLGAVLQQTLYDPNTGKVLVGSTAPGSAAKWTKITGYNVLDNNAVNFVASSATAFLTAWVGSRLL
ncbi:hypothetical protein BCV70DRAFT_102663 [Testicularia cyperi]|uniref:DUF92-domain-containing protein n=1 Tax=Testicularia cyperi TaxID=1882483 RepID=A0A317XPW4_9BASI|nr:hypothetical protein BCV70DRAFT_102663 [Testicularia cyperi]